MLAMVDAHPGVAVPSTLASRRAMEDAKIQVTNGLRELFGRPAHAYGVTPLYVFRKVQGGIGLN